MNGSASLDTKSNKLVKIEESLLNQKSLTSVFWVNGQVLIVDDNGPFQVCLREDAFFLVVQFLKVPKTLASMAHVVLLWLVVRCEDSFVAILEVALLRVNEIKDLVDVAAQTVRIHIEGAEGLQKLEHLLNALAHD